MMRSLPNKLFLLLLLLTISLPSCLSPRFVSAADMFGTYGVVNQADGTKLTGYFTNTASDVGGYGLYYSAKQSKKLNDYKLVPFKYIINIEINGGLYEPRLLEINPAGNNRYVMVKKISPREYTKMCLYELDYDESDKTSSAGQSKPSFTRKKYFVQLPGGPGMPIYNLESTRFSPSLNQKMSDIVADCPVLALKIKNKEQGYFFRLIHDSNNTLTVFQRIVEEYNNCK